LVPFPGAPHAIEFVLLFIAGPALFAYTRHRIPAIPALWGLTGWCLWVLLRDPGFDRHRLWNSDNFFRFAPEILALFGLVLFVGIVLILRYSPELFLGLPRSNPRTWGLLMVLYPVLSVYPQGVVFRVFVFYRYRDLFGPDWAIVAASAAAFAWVHIVFHNRLALVLTALGGVLLGLRYLQTSSLLVSSFEHALYGCAIFTVGIGRSFYHSAMRRT
jgi:membrane protease YdiL (CAAX protease family)